MPDEEDERVPLPKPTAETQRCVVCGQDAPQHTVADERCLACQVAAFLKNLN